MLIQLEEINAIINRFAGTHRKTIVNHYLSRARAKLADPKPMGRKKMWLLRNSLQYIELDSRIDYIREMLSNKVLQTRALVLDLINANYAFDKKHLYKPESWMEHIIFDIEEAFETARLEPKAGVSTAHPRGDIGKMVTEAFSEIGDSPTALLSDPRVDQILLGEYNRQLCIEMLNIFISCERFNTAGNQLILSLFAYQDRVGKYVDYDFKDMNQMLIGRFQPGTYFGDERIAQIYAEFVSKSASIQESE